MQGQKENATPPADTEFRKKKSKRSTVQAKLSQDFGNNLVQRSPLVTKTQSTGNISKPSYDLIPFQILLKATMDRQNQLRTAYA